MSDDCGQIRALAFLPFFRNKLKLPQPAEGRPQPPPGEPVERTQEMEAQRRAESDRQTRDREHREARERNERKLREANFVQRRK